jgi:hypothetical protein
LFHNVLNPWKEKFFIKMRGRFQYLGPGALRKGCCSVYVGYSGEGELDGKTIEESLPDQSQFEDDRFIKTKIGIANVGLAQIADDSQFPNLRKLFNAAFLKGIEEYVKQIPADVQHHPGAQETD